MTITGVIAGIIWPAIKIAGAMYSDSEVQKLKVFGFGEISTSAKILPLEAFVA